MVEGFCRKIVESNFRFCVNYIENNKKQQHYIPTDQSVSNGEFCLVQEINIRFKFEFNGFK